MGPILNRATAEQRREAALAVEELIAVLALADAKLPSVEVDWEYGRLTGAYLINLGSARTAQILRITDLLRQGLRHERGAGTE
ncbi:hypothetical protein [Streptomyces sp. CB01881]|uniref:hypothetical protein n=1 Tax=Streptomyces sp. CB01881 TaxID=2078691 RepID=UPI000CDCBCB0|nr:hypothetical protein [Streptomyces sp. CB01881]AUY52768.1 hypothetical protein C2142_31970 [Streptomyces sp. CB01881]TYC70486.1 hypothetical protein EH183_32035 [Streptomyces sp. CB01881]